ncbi:MAG TPA: PASTA domain-containing protein, partial [Solirubrobacterales bacterium]|nr:PASTA domain-containing protein [Solirubrobacterales bacterium]
GPNEYSTRGGADWKAKLVAYQQRLYEEVKGDPALSSLPVIGPSITHNDQQELGDVSDFLDYGNIHSYPEGNPPEYKMGSIVERAAYNSASKPIVATESGYTNALNWTPTGPGENKPISEAAAAAYFPRLFFEYFIRHIARTFSYELVDQRPNPGLDDREEHFGLLRNDLSEKPAFSVLRNTIDILEDPGPEFSPQSLDYVLSEGGATLHSALLQKRDGRFYLALWRLKSVWNPDEKKTLIAPSEPVTVSVELGVKSYAVYSPIASSEPILSVSQPTESLTVDVGPEVMIVELTPGVPASPVATPSPFPPPLVPLPAEHCIVPRLKGKTLQRSRKRSKIAHCKIGKFKKKVGVTVRAGRVVKQSPRPGSVLPLGGQIRVTLGS